MVLGEFLAAWSGKMAFLWTAGSILPAAFVYRRKGHRDGRFYLLLPPAFLAGVLLYTKAAAPDALLRLYREAENAPQVTIRASAERFQKKKNGYWIYLENAEVEWDGRCFGGQGLIWSCEELPAVKIGSRVELRGELGQFSAASNPGEFDMYRYYRACGYGYYADSVSWRVIGKGFDPVRQFLWKLRGRLSENIEYCAPEDAAVLKAVFLGETQDVGEDIRLLYQDQGISHLLSVSGLHITLLCMAVYRILRYITGSCGLAGTAGGIFAVCYGIFTGGTVSGKRAVIMYILSVLAAWRGRIFDMPTALGIAAVLTAVHHPLAVMEAPFLLSYMAVVGISVFGEMWNGFLPAGKDGKQLFTVGMQNGILPVMLYFYYQYPLYSILINQMVLPFSGILIAAAAGSGIFGKIHGAGWMFGQAGHWILWYYEKLCRLFSGLPGNRQINGRPSPWRMAVYAVCLVGIGILSQRTQKEKKKDSNVETAAPQGRRKSVIVYGGAWLFLAAACLFLRADPVKKLTVTMLDVGQGDCFLIQVPGGISFLSDAGSSSRTGLSQYTLEPVLLSKGIGTLDGILLSHGDADHVNGAEEMLERGRVKVGFLGIPDYKEAEKDFEEILSVVREKQCPLFRIGEGDTIKLGEVSLVFLHPQTGQSFSERNASSLVYLMKYRNFSMLFTGDIGMEQEMEAGRVDVLKTAHHGSQYSTSEKWLAQLNPSAALISCGEDNRYGHPHRELLARMERQGTDYYITAADGPVQVISDGDGFAVCRLIR